MVLIAAAWMRFTYAVDVFVGPEVMPVGLDSHYHWRRMQQAAETFPSLAVVDPFLSWPNGAAIPWAPGFDQLGATVVLALGPRATMFLPLVLGLITAWLVMRVAARVGGDDAERVALVAGLVFAVLPQATAVAAVGRMDHHVVEPLAVGLWMLWTLDGIESPPEPNWRFEGVGALIALASVYLFHGNIAYLALAAAVLSVAHLRRRSRPLVGSGAIGLGMAAVVLALAFRPMVATHGHPWSFMFASYLQPVLVGLAGMMLALAGLASRIIGSDEDPTPQIVLARAAAVGVVLVVAVLGMSALGMSELAAGGSGVEAGLVGWLGKGNAWMATIGETRPLFSGSPASWDAWETCYRFFGPFGLSAAVVVPLGAYEAWRRSRPRAAWLAGFASVLIGLTLLQARFGRVGVVILAVLVALALERLMTFVDARVRRERDEPPGWVAWIPIVLVIVTVVADPRLRAGLWRTSRPLPAINEVALFLRDHTPSRDCGRGQRRGGAVEPWLRHRGARRAARLGERLWPLRRGRRLRAGRRYLAAGRDCSRRADGGDRCRVRGRGAPRPSSGESRRRKRPRRSFATPTVGISSRRPTFATSRSARWCSVAREPSNALISATSCRCSQPALAWRASRCPYLDSGCTSGSLGHACKARAPTGGSRGSWS